MTKPGGRPDRHLSPAPRHASRPGARQTLRSQRIVIIGPVASGKTTLARSISSTLGLPLVDLDDLYWCRTQLPSEAEWAESTGRRSFGRLG